MSQYINLLSPAFRKQHMMLTLGRAVQAVAVTVVVMVALQMYNQHLVKGLREELASAQRVIKAQSTHTARLTGKGAAKKGNTSLDLEVQRLENELRSARHSTGVLEGGALGNRTGFAGYLKAFSHQAIYGLWLTGFSVAGSGDVAINGRVLKPDLLPVYIQKLNNEPVLRGRAFSALEVRRPATLAKDREKAQPHRYLEFALTSSDAKDAQGSGK